MEWLDMAKCNEAVKELNVLFAGKPRSWILMLMIIWNVKYWIVGKHKDEEWDNDNVVFTFTN
jgi:hypothetical protein